MNAVIMAGGEGSRLRPITSSIPKPMAKIAGKPVMEHIIDLLTKNDIKKAAATLLYLPNEIKEYFENGQNYGIELKYYMEELPLGTAGGVKAALDYMEEDFLVISGDAACDFELKRAIAFHMVNKADATIILKNMDEPLEYGVVVCAPDGKIERFIEKPSWDRVYSSLINTGIYILNKRIFDLVPDGKPYDFGKNLFPELLSKGYKLYGYEAEGYWCDIGSPAAYLQCNMDVLENKYSCYYNNYKQPGTKAVIVEPVILGKNVKLGDKAIIGPNVIIGDDCIVGQCATIKNSVIEQGCYIGNFCEIRGATICAHSSLDHNARLFEGVITGSGSKIGKNAYISNSAKIWPEKTVPDNAKIVSDVVWGQCKSALLSDNEVCSDLTGISPQSACRLGSVLYGMGKEKILIGYSDEPSCKAIATAVSLGHLFCDGSVYMIKNVPENIFAYTQQRFGIPLGLAVDAQTGSAHITLTEYGYQPTSDFEKKLESSFDKDDIKRENGNINEAVYIDGVEQLYYNDLINRFDFDGQKLNAVIHCPDKMLSCILTAALKKNKVNSQNADLSFFVSPDGKALSFTDEKGRYYTSEQGTAVLALAKILSGQKEITLDYKAPFVIDDIAKKYGAAIIRVTKNQQDKKEKFKNSSSFFDAGCAVLELLNAMVSLSVPLHKICADVPSFTISTLSVDIEGDKSRILERLAASRPENTELIQGIKLSMDEGKVLVTPNKSGNKFNIRAEARSAEAGNDMCHTIMELIKENKNKEKV